MSNSKWIGEFYWDNGKTKTGHKTKWVPWHIVALDNSAKVSEPYDELCEAWARETTITILRMMGVGRRTNGDA